jgi:hypothetical protein
MIGFASGIRRRQARPLYLGILAPALASAGCGGFSKFRNMDRAVLANFEVNQKNRGNERNV